MSFTFPKGVLAQHIAILGKTGSGKSSTGKLIVEQVVAEDARVCILDPIKSDWWGLTSSADGKRAGLPFQILGGPHGHVPLHSSSGKAIGEIVANGALPLSIIDMADFEPGGSSKFFVDFAAALIRKMRGVVYLVIEEAHLFAPKERSGVGKENLSIHWAKTMATAGRSKGIRLVLVTQRTQALHNALLGSCDTLIAHRMTAPADQEPVVKWLKANTSKEITERVAGSMSSLPTGSGWLCSGEEKLFELVKFPRIKTYDNTATPTGDEALNQVKTAPVDADKLRAIIGEAVKLAEANDPAVLKRRIAELERDARRPLVLPTSDAAQEAAWDRGYQEGFQVGFRRALDDAYKVVGDYVGSIKQTFNDMGTAVLSITPAAAPAPSGAMRSAQRSISPPVKTPVKTREEPAPINGNGHDRLTGVSQRILNGLAELEQMGAAEPTRELLAFMAGYSHIGSKGFANGLGALRSQGLIDGIRLTDAGRAVAQPPAQARTPAELQDRIISLLGGASGRVLRPLIEAYPKPIERQSLAEAAGYGHIASKGFTNAIGRMRTLGFIDYPDRGHVIAKPLLFFE